ncbi:hypothetical protein ACLVWU_04125 [Bdellovibrio sp. HCB290]|uniref:hypothetical protein n=1 Tax=Bdellovibrio sp. HCB290 TaxID=3394356 RepID=UPI0039B64523
MKVLVSGLLILFAGIQSQAAAVIQSASNIHNGKIIVAVDITDPARRVFMEVDARSGKKESLGFPNDLVSEDIMAVVSLPEYVVVLSQWTSGDGRKPKVHEYVRSSKIWMAAGDLNCLSFDQIEIEKSELRVQCADENKEGLATGPVKMALDFTAKSAVKVNLPIQEASSGAVGFVLKGGSMFKWASMEVTSGKAKKSYSAEDLSLSSDAKIKKTIKVKETIGPKE